MYNLSEEWCVLRREVKTMSAMRKCRQCIYYPKCNENYCPTAERKWEWRIRMNYKSPIEIINKSIETHIEDDVIKAVHKYGIDVDKSELIKALSYDRDQYNKGFQDGYRTGRMTAMYDQLEKPTEVMNNKISNL